MKRVQVAGWIFLLASAWLMGGCSEEKKAEVKTAAPAEVKTTTAEGEWTVVPGESVGKIKPGMKLAEIQKLYGEKNIQEGPIAMPGGDSLDGAKLFAGTDRELELFWVPEQPDKILSDINVVGSAWTFSNGLKPGLTLVEVEKINGKTFKISGFGWDYGGAVVDFEGGALDRKVSMFFEPGEGTIDDALSGDREISSTDEKLRKLDPRLTSPITVNMQVEER